jgi:predicted ribosomally synthesized peptide with SipW-like signal peptide
MKKNRDVRVGLTLLVLAALGLLAAFATLAAFSDTTDNSGNRFQTGSVAIADNDLGTTALYDLYDGTPEARPGQSDSGCIKVTYSGSFDSDVRLYSTSTLNANALDDNMQLVVTPGTGVALDCSDFNAGGQAAIFNNTLANFMANRNSYTNGLADYPGTVATKWATSDAVTYKFEVTLTDDADVNDANSQAASGYATGLHTFTWEARNQ